MASDELTAQFRALMPFCDVLGMEVLEVGPDRVVTRGAWRDEFCTAGGILHGGYVMALADSTGAACAVQNLPEGAGTSTIESKTNFLGAVRGGSITVTSTPVHVGGSTIVVQTDAVNDDGKLVSRSTQTQAVLRPRG